MLQKPKYQPTSSASITNASYGVTGGASGGIGGGGGGSLGGGGFGAQSSYLSGNSSSSNPLNKNPLGGAYKPSILGSLGGLNSGNNNVSTSSSAGTNGYLPPSGAGTGSRFGRLAQFGVMSGAGGGGNTSITSGSNASHQHNANDGGSSSMGNSFVSALGFGRHKV